MNERGDVDDVLGFDGIAEFVEGNTERCSEMLQRYFNPDGPNGGFAGRWFEYFSIRSDPMHLDANDVAAAAALSVPLDGRALSSLFARAGELDELLRHSPTRATPLWEVDEAVLAAGSPLWSAYDLLRSIPGVGYVRASKLLACKRPNLVPIRDTVVEQLLGAGTSWWRPWRDVVSNERLRTAVDALTPSAVPDGTSLLRRLDVILWMFGKGP